MIIIADRRNHLLNALNNRFNNDDIDHIVYSLGFDSDNYRGTLKNKTVKLLQDCEKKEILEDLLNLLIQERPKVDWHKYFQTDSLQNAQNQPENQPRIENDTRFSGIESSLVQENQNRQRSRATYDQEIVALPDSTNSQKSNTSSDNPEIRLCKKLSRWPISGLVVIGIFTLVVTFSIDFFQLLGIQNCSGRSVILWGFLLYCLFLFGFTTLFSPCKFLFEEEWGVWAKWDRIAGLTIALLFLATMAYFMAICEETIQDRDMTPPPSTFATVDATETGTGSSTPTDVISSTVTASPTLPTLTPSPNGQTVTPSITPTIMSSGTATATLTATSTATLTATSTATVVPQPSPNPCQTRSPIQTPTPNPSATAGPSPTATNPVPPYCTSTPTSTSSPTSTNTPTNIPTNEPPTVPATIPPICLPGRTC